jgi:mercuric ion transport protein
MKVNANEQAVTEPGLVGRMLMPLAAALAVLSASCCVLPIGLSIIGLGGTWLTMLGPFIAYREFILFGVAVALIWAWYRVVRLKPCVTRMRSAIVWASLASIAFLVALSSPYWEASAQRFMWDLWRSTR